MNLTPLQQEALVMMRIGKSILLTGQAGTGKSAVLKEFLSLNEDDDQSVAVTSTTGISAIEIGGRTLHSWAGIGLGDETEYALYKRVRGNKDARKRWERTRVLIIDEISMLSAALFDKLEAIARLIRRSQEPFGGIQLVLCGDFCQLPVIGDVKFCFEATSWSNCVKKNIHLQQIMRQDDPEFCRLLEEVRLGVVSDKTIAILQTRVISETQVSEAAETVDKFAIEPTRLFSRNSVVHRINSRHLKELIDAGAVNHTYKTVVSSDDIKIVKDKQYLETFPECTLAVGAQVILRWNIDVEGQLANGSRGVVIDFVNTYPTVRFKSGRTCTIRPVVIKTKQDKHTVNITWMPFILGWASSIHRSQGCTLDYVITSLGTTDIFEFGQAYVALSRVRQLNGLFLEDFDPAVFKCHPSVKEFYMRLDS